MSLIRKLQFDDKFVYELVQTATGCFETSPLTFPDQETPVKFVVEMNLTEFTKVFSALMTGADLSYPEQAHEVVWLFLKNLECPVSICDEIADCIDASDVVRNALAQWFSYAVDNDIVVQQALERAFDAMKRGAPIPQGYADQNQYGEALGCDNNDGWGHIRNGLIERSFQRVIDVLEQIETVTNNQEMLAQFLNAIPVVGAALDVIPVTDWVLFFDNVRAVLKEEFEAGDTLALRDQVACDLFCIWQIDCSLSLEQIRSYYWDKTIILNPDWDGAFNSFGALAAALGYVSAGNIGEAVVYALVGSQYGFLTFINDWFGITIASTSSDLALGDPSDDWEVLCDECPDFCDTPVISDNDPFSSYPFPQGANIQPVVGEECYYTIDATTNPDTVEAIQFNAIDNGDFRISDITYPNGITTGTIYARIGGVWVEQVGTPAVIDGLTGFGIVFQSSTLPGQIKFKMTNV